VIGLVQATEVVKLLAGFGEPLIGRLLTYDAVGMHFREVKLRRDPNCPLCGHNATIKDLSIHMEGSGEVCAVGDNGQSAPDAVPLPSAKPGG
jgi:adenylyltransferase/sulfurtransferase